VPVFTYSITKTICPVVSSAMSRGPYIMIGWKCVMHLSFASRSLPPYIALTICTISRGGVKINVSCYMIKLDFWPWPPVEKKGKISHTIVLPVLTFQYQPLGRPRVRFLKARCRLIIVPKLPLDPNQPTNQPILRTRSRGIIQGSGVGPYLYITMESDLKPKSPCNMLFKYVDDTNLAVP